MSQQQKSYSLNKKSEDIEKSVKPNENKKPLIKTGETQIKNS